MQFIQPGKLMQNGYIERKKGSVRKELLDAYLFYNLTNVRAMYEQWRNDYNLERPHKSLGYKSPLNYLNQWMAKFEICDTTALSTRASKN